MCTMVLLANVGETMLSRAATLYQLFARRITMTEGNLLGNYMAITDYRHTFPRATISYFVPELKTT